MTAPTPTSPEDGRETRLVEVKGRTIVVRQLLDAQMLFLAREAKLLQNAETTGDRRVAGMVRMFDTLESQVVQEADREYLLDLVSKGNLELKDLMEFVTVFQDEAQEKPKVRRGRRPASAR